MENSKVIDYRALKLEDVYTFKNWGKHDSILYLDYNFCEDSKEEMKEWYDWKTSSPLSKYFAVMLNDKVIGFVSIKKVNRINKSGTLGIVLDPNYINMGIGKAILKKFFKDLKDVGFRKIILYVAAFNKRAINLYTKLGFRKVSKKLMPFTNGKLSEDDPEFIENRDSFKIILNKPFFYAYKMKLYL